MHKDDRLESISRRLTTLRVDLTEHPVYCHIDSIDRLRLFMQYHVFAVWDFMSLLKSLQHKLCSSTVPWFPPTDPLAARLVNEIVLGEESDEDGRGGFASHFDLYHHAMRRCNASTRMIDEFLRDLRASGDIATTLSRCDLPDSVRHFVHETFHIIHSDDICAIASAFTFGREDLLPDVFQCLVDRLNVEFDGHLDGFMYYLNRHIELDGEQHGPMAARMIAGLCGDSEANWLSAERAAVRSLQARKALWDEMYASMAFD